MFKKTTVLFLAIIICFSAVVPAFAEEEFDFPCGGVIENLPAEILYFPIQNLIVFGTEDPNISGAVIQVVYPDGTIEKLKIIPNGNSYYAGEFSADIYDFSGNNASEKYGLVTKTISMYRDLSHGGYSAYIDLVYLHIPTLSELYELISERFANAF